jgi:hypothetical protein
MGGEVSVSHGLLVFWGIRPSEAEIYYRNYYRDHPLPEDGWGAYGKHITTPRESAREIAACAKFAEASTLQFVGGLIACLVRGMILTAIFFGLFSLPFYLASK